MFHCCMAVSNSPCGADMLRLFSCVLTLNGLDRLRVSHRDLDESIDADITSEGGNHQLHHAHTETRAWQTRGAQETHRTHQHRQTSTDPDEASQGTNIASGGSRTAEQTQRRKGSSWRAATDVVLLGQPVRNELLSHLGQYGAQRRIGINTTLNTKQDDQQREQKGGQAETSQKLSQQMAISLLHEPTTNSTAHEGCR
jgi:hypothetical protein